MYPWAVYSDRCTFNIIPLHAYLRYFLVPKSTSAWQVRRWEIPWNLVWATENKECTEWRWRVHHCAVLPQRWWLHQCGQQSMGKHWFYALSTEWNHRRGLDQPVVPRLTLDHLLRWPGWKVPHPGYGLYELRCDIRLWEHPSKRFSYLRVLLDHYSRQHGRRYGWVWRDDG